MTAFQTFIRSLSPRTVMIALCVVYLGVAGLTFEDYGVNPDEGLHIANGKAVVDWYASGFENREIFRWTNIWAYGGAYDVLCHFAVQVSPFEVHATRHLLTALVGLIGLGGPHVELLRRELLHQLVLNAGYLLRKPLLRTATLL